MSNTDLPPLPKSLSEYTQMLCSDSGVISDSDGNIENANKSVEADSSLTNSNNNHNINHKTNKRIDVSFECNRTTKEVEESNGNGNDSTTNSESSALTITTAGNTLDTQLAMLKKEMHGLRQLDISLLSQLWVLNDSIQEFRTMLQEQEAQDADEEGDAYSNSRTSSSYDGTSSENEENDEEEQQQILQAAKKNLGAVPKIITTQPKLTTSHLKENYTHHSLNTTNSFNFSRSRLSSPPPQLRQPHQQFTGDEQNISRERPVPKPIDIKSVTRMRSAPPPPPTSRKGAAPPRPT